MTTASVPGGRFTRSHALQNYDHNDVPTFGAFDRMVLRFFGFFKEAIYETNLENYRIRNVKVLYYLEDHTCHVLEPKQDNSGIPQGQLIKRHRFPAPGGGYITPRDLQVGSTIHVYGKTIQLTDCDTFTRQYYKQAGMDQPEPVPEEADAFQQTQEAMRVKTAVRPRTYENLYTEVMLGGGTLNDGMQQFMDHDKKVLRFYAVLDDVSNPHLRPFSLLFYMSDDTMEISEQYPVNCGRDYFPTFFRRDKIPAGPTTVDGPMSQLKSVTDYVQKHDFHVGKIVTLVSHKFFIYDADDFTRWYFRQHMGIELAPKIELQQPELVQPKLAPPPHSGYGTQADSLSSVINLVPRAPRKDLRKFYTNDGKICRFTAKFVDPKPEDTERVFVVNFHLGDDTLSINEPPQRNLGIMAGKFLKKAEHINQMTGKNFEMNDLYPGNVIKVYNHEFEIMDMDDFTKKIFADPASIQTQHM